MKLGIEVLIARIAQLESEKAALVAALRATQRHFDEAMSEGVDADAICAIRELVQDALAAADHHKGD